MPDRLMISAGPLYVDMSSAPTDIPEGEYHTVLRPLGKGLVERERSWGNEREAGGSAFKVAQYWIEEEHGKSVFVSRIAPCEANGNGRLWEHRAFYDDPRWLHEKIEDVRQALKTRGGALAADKLKLCIDPVEGAEMSYALHMPHLRGDLPWSILSMDGGAERQVVWQDVVDAWQRCGPPVEKVVVYLGGVLRTRLLQTLASAIDEEDESTRALLMAAHLFIEFGRTDLRRKPGDSEAEASRLGKDWRRILKTCLNRAHGAFMDFSTATALKLQAAEMMPEGFLVVRPHGVQGGRWDMLRRSEDAKSLVRRSFEAPERPEKDKKRTERPWRVTQVMYSMLRPRTLVGAADWEPYFDVQLFTKPGEITQHPPLLERLEELERELENFREPTLILLVGPTGVGKEVIARWIHRIHQRRMTHPFLPISGGSLKGEVVNAELFGSYKGAFTGVETRKGAFLAADGGVLLLDELEDLTLDAQERLLRVIEFGEVKRIGGDHIEKTNVLLIVATNLDPERLVKLGRLRPDLQNRLMGGFRIDIPALTERRGDAVRTAKAYWEHLNNRYGVARPWPSALETWLKTEAALKGNYRVLEAHLKYVHARARRLEAGEYDAATFEIPGDLNARDITITPPAHGNEQARMVEQLKALNRKFDALNATIAKQASKGGAKDGAAGDSPKRSACCTALAARAGEELRLIQDDQARFDRLLVLWDEVQSEHEPGNRALFRREFAWLLGMTDGSALRALLKASKESDAVLRVKPTGSGQSSAWVLVRGTVSRPDPPPDEGRSGGMTSSTGA